MLRVAEQYSATDTGRQRRANEDALLARAPLFLVADGMGGAQAGEVASHIAVESFRGGLGGDGRNAEGRLSALIQEANARIHQLSRSNAEQAGMGTTLTVAYVGEDEVALAHVGDSRAYCLRDGELQRLTDDHSLVDELIRQGRLTPAEAEEHPQRSVITRALGPEPTVDVDTRTHRARTGDIYLVCSDGLTSMVSEPRVAEIIMGSSNLHEAGESLLKAANEAGGRDNITVVLFRLEEVGVQSARAEGSPASEDEQHTMITSAPLAPPRRVTPRVPRRGHHTPAARPSRRRVWRRAGLPVAVVVVLALMLTGAYLASQSVYFIGTNDRGLVTVFSGLPYELPGPIKLYTQYFVSGVPASTLPRARRQSLLDDSWRSKRDASSLVRSLELGELSGP